MERSALRSKSGMLLRCGLGILLSTTAPSAGTTLWIFVSSARPTRPRRPVRSAQWLGEYATTHSTSIAYRDGSRLDKYVLWTIVTGNFKSMAGKERRAICLRPVGRKHAGRERTSDGAAATMGGGNNEG